MARMNCVCVDGSEHSIVTFNWYLENYHRQHDIVGIVHILQIPNLQSMGVVAGGSIAMETKVHENIKQLKEAGQQLVNTYIGICDEHKAKYKPLLCESDRMSPGEMICKAANDNHADAIVLGQRGLSQFSRSLLGSTSDYIMHNASIPVTVIPPKSTS